MLLATTSSSTLPKLHAKQQNHHQFRSTLFRSSPERIQTARRASNQGKDVLEGAVEGWLDVANFVSGGSGNKTPYADLAYKIGTREVLVTSKLSSTA